MPFFAFLFLCCTFCSCRNQSTVSPPPSIPDAPLLSHQLVADTNSWAYFLQHLPEKKGPVLDYRGVPVDDQQKHAAIINYDVGHRNLQQCADALMRLWAEYLFSQKRYSQIGFHFTSGHRYTYGDYCRGKRPVPQGNTVRFTNTAPGDISHGSLRHYLDIVYTYAGTISLASELSAAQEPAIGVVIIKPGSPGHCLIITDAARTASGEKLFKLVEGYTPAQSIYVLRNTTEPALGYWHRLRNGPLETASYVFDSYQLKTFE